MTASPRDPRANQKQRTRAAIVEAAARLLRAGQAPSVADAAAEAKVSRATAYRYFPTPESLHLEVASITPTFAPVEKLVQALDGDDAAGRVLRLQSEANAITFAEEAQMRIALRVYLDTWFASRSNGADAPALREGRRMRWLDLALEPARRGMQRQHWQRLRAALALTLGAEAMIVMKDVCRLSDAEAKDVLRWAAQALLQAASFGKHGANARASVRRPRNKAAD
jgi:AcrR family transcriptional regulator